MCENRGGLFAIDSSILFIKGCEHLGVVEITDNNKRAADFCRVIRGIFMWMLRPVLSILFKSSKAHMAGIYICFVPKGNKLQLGKRGQFPEKL